MVPFVSTPNGFHLAAKFIYSNLRAFFCLLTNCLLVGISDEDLLTPDIGEDIDIVDSKDGLSDDLLEAGSEDALAEEEEELPLPEEEIGDEELPPEDEDLIDDLEEIEAPLPVDVHVAKDSTEQNYDEDAAEFNEPLPNVLEDHVEVLAYVEEKKNEEEKVEHDKMKSESPTPQLPEEDSKSEEELNPPPELPLDEDDDDEDEDDEEEEELVPMKDAPTQHTPPSLPPPSGFCSNVIFLYRW